MYTWCTLRVRDGRVETVDSWPTLGEVIWEMACSSWEEPGNEWLSYVVDAAGVLVATAIFDRRPEFARHHRRRAAVALPGAGVLLRGRGREKQS
jgi:hypothetical protein